MKIALKTEKKRIFRCLKGGESGQILIMVLILLLLGTVILTPLLSFTIGGMKQGQSDEQNKSKFYAADSGVEDGMWQVSNGSLPSWMSVSPWDHTVYQHTPYQYSLPQSVNGETVTVKIQPVWVLEGLESENTTQNMDPSQSLITDGYAVGSGQFKIVIIADNASNYNLNRIGVWLPQGFTYTMGSSNLEGLAHTNPAYCVPTVSSFRNGYTVTWDYGTAVAFSSFPLEASNRIAITFNYTPAASSVGNAFAWCRTNSTTIPISCSSDLKQYRITSQATDPSTGRTTTVTTYTMINQTVGTSSALNGDYETTGNALLRDQDGDNQRERLYKETPGTITAIPSTATPRKIMLYWSGWKSYPNDVWYENSDNISAWSTDDQQALLDLASEARVTEVSLKVQVGSSLLQTTVTADGWEVLPESITGSNQTDYWDYPVGWSYACYADITSLVDSYFSGLGVSFVGNATYTVGHADLGVIAPTTNQIEGVWGTSSSNVVIVGASGTIDNYNGTSWSSMTSGTTQNLYSVWGSDASHVFAVGASGTIRYYNGSTWSSMTSGTTNALNGVWGSDASHVFAVGASGTIRYYNGSTWSSMTSGTTNALNAVWGSDASHVFAVGASGTIRYYNGSSWGSLTSGTTQALNGVWGTGPNNVYAVGASGTIRYWNGTSWTSMTSGTSNALYSVWGSDATHVYAVGVGGTILFYNGSAWSAMDSGSTSNLYGVWGSSSSDIYAAGQAGTILHYDGSQWASVTGDYDLYSYNATNHPAETVVANTDYMLGDGNDLNNQLSYAMWSVVVVYTSPETIGHQLYLYDPSLSGGFQHWEHYADKTFTISSFLAPQDILTNPTSAAARLTFFVGEGDEQLSGHTSGYTVFQEKVYLNGVVLNTGAVGTWNENDNAWNSISTVGTTGLDGMDLKTYTVTYPTIKPGDSQATLRMTTQMDVWQLVYMILSFRSDVTNSGLLSYIVQ